VPPEKVNSLVIGEERPLANETLAVGKRPKKMS